MSARKLFKKKKCKQENYYLKKKSKKICHIKEGWELKELI